MFNQNTPIDQLIYTAGGTKKRGIDNGNFGTYSKSNGIDEKAKAEIEDKLRIILKGNPEDYRAKYTRQQVLKRGATPHGLFVKKYNDSDYQTIKVLTSAPIQIISQSDKGDLRHTVNPSEDYRDNPEKAPHRIAASKLSDGRLMIVQERAINKIYSNRDTRTGNYFCHVLVFPQGVELADIDIKSLTFRNGLTTNEWEKNSIEAPKSLPTTSISTQRIQSSQQHDSKEDLNIKELLDTYRKTLLTNKDYKSRTESKKIFNKEISAGTNLLKIKCIIKKMAIDDSNQTKNTNDFYENMLTDLELTETPHTKLISSLESLFKYNNALNSAYEDNNQQIINSLEVKINDLNSSIKSQLKEFSIEELKEIVTLQKENLKLSEELDALNNGRKFSPLNGTYMLKDNFKAIKILEKTLSQQSKKTSR